MAVAGLLAFLLLAPDGPNGSPNAAPPPPPAAAGTAARPADVPSTCKDKGATDFAEDVEALKEWKCRIAPSVAVTGTGYAYLEFGDAADARDSFIDSRTYELGHGWTTCPAALSGELSVAGTREAWCAQKTSDGTVEVVWHNEGSTVVGSLTCDPPTTVESTIKLWTRLVS